MIAPPIAPATPAATTAPELGVLSTMLLKMANVDFNNNQIRFL